MYIIPHNNRNGTKMRKKHSCMRTHNNQKRMRTIEDDFFLIGCILAALAAVLAGISPAQAAALPVPLSQRVLLSRLRRYKGRPRTFKRPFHTVRLFSSGCALWRGHLSVFYDYTDN